MKLDVAPASAPTFTAVNALLDCLTTELPNTANDFKSSKEDINANCQHIISRIVLESRKAKAPITAANDTKNLLPQLAKFLRWLDLEVNINETIRKETKIVGALKLIYDDPNHAFEQRFKDYARQLHNK